jgi:hypothetical protein
VGSASHQIIGELPPGSLDTNHYPWVVRLAYRAVWSPDEEQAKHFVYFPKSSDPAVDDFVNVPYRTRKQLPFIAPSTGSRPLTLAARGEFRQLVEAAEGGDFAAALDDTLRTISDEAVTLSSGRQVGSTLQTVLAPLAPTLELEEAAASQFVRFLPQGGSLTGLLRSLVPTLALDDDGLWLPLERHGSSLAAAVGGAEALAAASTNDAVVAIDDFGDRLDAGTARHLAATLRACVGQAWVSTRQPPVADAFAPREIIRLTRRGRQRFAHHGQRPATKAERIAARHFSTQLLPSMTARVLAVLEGPRRTGRTAGAPAWRGV